MSCIVSLAATRCWRFMAAMTMVLVLSALPCLDAGAAGLGLGLLNTLDFGMLPQHGTLLAMRIGLTLELLKESIRLAIHESAVTTRTVSCPIC